MSKLSTALVHALGAVALLTTCLALPATAAEESAAAPPAEPGPEAATPELMRGILGAITRLLPSSLEPADFESPERLPRNLEDLGILARNAERLAGHGREGDESFAFLSDTLARDAREVHRRYEHGRFDEARFLLYQIVDDCVACHTRLPAGDGLPQAAAFTASLDGATLAPEARLRLLLATRQFEAALDLVEGMVADPEVSPAMLEFQGYLTEYLTTAVRVRGELTRAAATLRALAARPDTPRYLERDLAIWIEALEDQAARKASTPSIAQARALIDRGRGLNLYPLDRRGLVYFLLASSDLHRILEEERAPEQHAEALYLLGVSVSHLSLSQWPRQAESYLAEAIRLAPGGDFAEDAYELLEERTLAGYSGSGGPHVPGDVARELEELRALIEAARASADEAS